MKIVCVNTRTYPPGVDVTVVLVEDEIGDYAAYAGGGRDATWIAYNGDKLCFDEAKIHFPIGLERSKYRER